MCANRREAIFDVLIFLKLVQDFSGRKGNDCWGTENGVSEIYNVIKSVVNFVKFVPIIMVRDKLSGLKDNRKQYMGCSIW